METEDLIQQVQLDELKNKTNKIIDFRKTENEKFVIEKWEDALGNTYHKTFNKHRNYTMYSKNGLLHNLNGPALIKGNGSMEWWYEDQHVATAFRNNNITKFSASTPVDESLITQPLNFLRLTTVLEAKHSHEKKSKVEISSIEFDLKNNVNLVVNNLRPKKNKKSNLMQSR